MKNASFGSVVIVSGPFSPSSTAAPLARAVARLEPFAKEGLVAHRRPVGMRGRHVAQVDVVVGQPDHQPQRLPDRARDLAPGVREAAAFRGGERFIDGHRAFPCGSRTQCAPRAATAPPIGSNGVSCAVGRLAARAAMQALML